MVQQPPSDLRRGIYYEPEEQPGFVSQSHIEIELNIQRNRKRKTSEGAIAMITRQTHGHVDSNSARQTRSQIRRTKLASAIQPAWRPEGLKAEGR
jgi:hypothetical protein